MRIEFEFDPIKTGKTILFVGLVIGAVVIALLWAMYIVGYVSIYYDNSVYQSGYSAGVASVPTATPTPTPAAITYPYTIVYRVSSTSTTGGLLQVFTKDGKTLIMPDYNTWNNQIPRDTYYATVTGADSSGRLYVSGVSFIGGNTRIYGNDYWSGYPQDHHHYYQNRNNRVQCAGNMICG